MYLLNIMKCIKKTAKHDDATLFINLLVNENLLNINKRYKAAIIVKGDVFLWHRKNIDEY